jgi:hypothetical protein
MAEYIYRGTPGKDTIDTQDISDSLNYYADIILYGEGGDDELYATIVGEDRIDELIGGPGNDFLATSSIGTGFASTIMDGGEGTDHCYLPFRINSFKKVNAGIEASGTSNDGSPITALVGVTNEFIANSVNGSTTYYLVEDLWNGRQRAVSWDELYARTHNGNNDWYFRSLDTYSSYHSSKPNPTPPAGGSAPDTDPITGGTTWQIPVGRPGGWYPRSKVRGSDYVWEVKGRGKKTRYLVDNNVLGYPNYNRDKDKIQGIGFNLDTMRVVDASRSLAAERYPNSVYLQDGKANVVAWFQNYSFSDYMERGFIPA